jgi:predicted kinase
MNMKQKNNYNKIASLFTGKELYNVLIHEKNSQLDLYSVRDTNNDEYSQKTNHDLIQELYQKVYPHYPNEYFFKNTLTNKLYLKKSNPQNCAYLSEFPVGNSVADVMMVNHTSRVFEIKTELDKPDRLKDQLVDYRKLFEEVYVVTHENLQEKYLKILPDDVGLYVVTNRSALKRIRKAKINTALDPAVMIAFLRIPEMENIIRKTYNTLPEYNTIRKYRAYRLLLNLLPFDVFHKLWKEQVRQRMRSKNLEVILDGTIPRELSHWYLAKIKTKKESEKLISNLYKTVQKPEKSCTFHI